VRVNKGEIILRAWLEEGVIYYEPKLLEEINFNLPNGKSQTWKFPADKKVGLIRISVNEGGVTVRIEQPIK